MRNLTQKNPFKAIEFSSKISEERGTLAKGGNFGKCEICGAREGIQEIDD